MIQDEFNRKLKEASCHLRQTEPFIPWSNIAERELKVLMRGSRRLMKHELHFCTKHTQTRWGYNWNNYIWRDVWHKQILWVWMIWMGNVWKWNGTISWWFLWIEERYLCLSIYVGPDMMTMIIKENSQVIHAQHFLFNLFYSSFSSVSASSLFFSLPFHHSFLCGCFYQDSQLEKFDHSKKWSF